jgi:hypothetical protein
MTQLRHGVTDYPPAHEPGVGTPRNALPRSGRLESAA